MKCCIVKDLLPGYIDGLTSEETNEEMKIICNHSRLLQKSISARGKRKNHRR